MAAPLRIPVLVKCKVIGVACAAAGTRRVAAAVAQTMRALRVLTGCDLGERATGWLRRDHVMISSFAISCPGSAPLGVLAVRRRSEDWQRRWTARWLVVLRPAFTMGQGRILRVTDDHRARVVERGDPGLLIDGTVGVVTTLIVRLNGTACQEGIFVRTPG